MPIFFFNHALHFAVADSVLVGGEMTKAIILKMQRDFKVRVMTIRKFYVFAVKRDLKVLRTKVKVIVDPCDPLHSRPCIIVDFNEDISKKQVS